MAEVTVPTADDLIWPTLGALKSLGGSGRIEEIFTAVAEQQGFSDQQLSVPAGGQHQMSRIEYNLAWARTSLKKADAIENPKRGVWAITERGYRMSEEEIYEEVRAAWHKYYQRRQLEEPSAPTEVDEEDDYVEPLYTELDWTAELLDCLNELEPSAFERLAQRILLEAGFRNVEVLGKSGDGGIDGVGVLRISLISFPVFFQCKRYGQPVDSNAVRDFRGAMAGRGEKGLLITTATFTPSAQAEANRDGAPPVELVDGSELCELLKKYKLGVSTRQVEEVEIDPDFFNQF